MIKSPQTQPLITQALAEGSQFEGFDRQKFNFYLQSFIVDQRNTPEKALSIFSNALEAYLSNPCLIRPKKGKTIEGQDMLEVMEIILNEVQYFRQALEIWYNNQKRWQALPHRPLVNKVRDQVKAIESLLDQ